MEALLCCHRAANTGWRIAHEKGQHPVRKRLDQSGIFVCRGCKFKPAAGLFSFPVLFACLFCGIPLLLPLFAEGIHILRAPFAPLFFLPHLA